MVASLITVHGVCERIFERLLELREDVDCAPVDNTEDAGDREGVSKPCDEDALPFGTGVGLVEPKRLLAFGELKRLLEFGELKGLLGFVEPKRLLVFVEPKIGFDVSEGVYVAPFTLSSSGLLSSLSLDCTRALERASGQGAMFAFSSASSIASSKGVPRIMTSSVRFSSTITRVGKTSSANWTGGKVEA